MMTLPLVNASYTEENFNPKEGNRARWVVFILAYD